MRPLFKQNILVDYKNFAFRAVAVGNKDGRSLVTSDGRPSGHVLRFVNMLLSIKKLGGDMFFCMEGNETKRFELLPEYKSNRGSGDIDPALVRIIENIKCSIVTPQNAEADDAIATLVASSNVRNYIVSADKDLWALLGPKVRISSYGEEVTAVDAEKKFGVPPKSITLAKALCGDPSDCIPRIPGLRWSQVLPIVKECVTPDELYNRLDELPVKTQKLLEEFKPTVVRLYNVVKLRHDCVLDINNRSGDLSKLHSIVVDEFECKSLQGKLQELL